MNQLLENTNVPENEHKKLKLYQALENNIKISNMNLPDKFRSFEDWELTRSKRLLYEISRNKNTYKRFPRGSIIRVDFGVNIGSEFSEQHFAITLNKRDNQFNSVLTVIPLTSKTHKGYIDLGDLIVSAYLTILQEEIDKLQEKVDEVDIENCELNPNYIKEIKKIEKTLSYQKKKKDNLTFACVNQICTISKLNVLPPMNEYDIVGKVKCEQKIMDMIDKEIIRLHTGINFPKFEQWFDDQKIEQIC